jgi:hypothetical protein
MAGRPVYMQVDEDELREIAEKLEAKLGHYDFLSALVLEVNATGAAFPYFERALDQWERGDPTAKPPPFVGLLAGCVLAASTMASDPAAGIAANNYYKRLSSVLGRTEEINESDKEFLVDCWNRLNQWLGIDNKGQRGQPTARARGHFRRIGYALSQCILRAEDRRRLADFFFWAGFGPGSRIPSADIRDEFFEWVALARCSLTPATRGTLSRCSPDVRELVAEIVSRELEDWDGSAWESQGGRVAPIFLQAVEVIPGRRFALRFVARRPESFPDGAYSNGKGEVHLREGGPGVYAPLDIAVTAGTLSEGISLKRPGYALRFRGASLHVLAPGSEFGELVSRDQTSLGEPFLVLLSGAVSEAGWALIERRGTPNHRRLGAEAGTPPGWTAVTDVTFTDTFNAPDDLAVLEPRLTVETNLVGGLKFAFDTWLTTAPPTLSIWSADARRVIVELDGKVIAEAETPLEIALDPAIGDGEHVLRVSGRQRTFLLRSTAPRPPSDGSEFIGWPLEKDDTALPPSTRRMENQAPGLCGAALRLTGGVQLPRVVRWFGNYDIETLHILGDCPGDVVEVAARSLVGQLHATAYQFRLPSFRPAWVAERKQGRSVLAPSAQRTHAPRFYAI